MYKLKDLLEQRNVSKINFGNAPKKLFNFAYSNGGRAFTIKTIRPNVPNLFIDIIKTINNSNSVGSSSSYGQDHVYIISDDLKKNTNKDVRNVIIIPRKQFDSLTTTITENGKEIGYYSDANILNILDKPIAFIGVSPVIYYRDFEKAMVEFNAWCNDSENLKLTRKKIAELEKTISDMKAAANQDATNDEDDEDANKNNTIIKTKEELAAMANKDVSTANQDTIYIYQKLLEGWAKTTESGPGPTAKPINTWQDAKDFLIKGADGDWGTNSKKFLATLQNTLTEVEGGDVITKTANIKGKENVYWSKSFMDITFEAIQSNILPGLKWTYKDVIDANRNKITTLSLVLPARVNESAGLIIKLKSLIK